MRLAKGPAILGRMRRFFFALAVMPLSIALPLACGSLPPYIPCGQIPADGCPIGRGGSCDDPVCEALYDCVDGVWRRVEACPFGTDAGEDANADAGLSPDACEVLVLDHKGETTGCKPDLQNPDCPAVAAETCSSSACLTDCIDFYLCTANGWSLVAYCNEEGQIVVAP